MWAGLLQRIPNISCTGGPQSKNEDVTECQNYVKDNCGRHTGCRFQNVTIENKYAYFLVNVSRSGQNIQSYEKKIWLYQIEKLTPPLNVTVNCTEASHSCNIWWQPPRTSHVKKSSCFKYEIAIENKADVEKKIKTASKREEIVENNSYLYESFSSGKKYSIRIRATDAGFCLVSPDWGEWSTPVEFGMNGSAIENFSCVIYNIFLMNCTWQAGREAPADTQYFLYWQKSRDEEEMECELYIKDENCRNVGCIFQNVSIGTEKAYFLVNGSSKDSLIQFYDEYIDLYKIEKLMPPSNITVNCDEIKNDCIIQWQRPQISHSDKDLCFKYEISIKYKDNPEGKPIYTSIQEGGNSNIFLRSNTRKKYVLKMRAAGSVCLVNPAWGEWSAPVEFGNYEIISPSGWILLGVAVTTPLMAIITFSFCKRTGCWKAAFSQIPGPKLAFFTLADTNPELMENKIQSLTSENEEIVLVADIVR
ncbi:granulocyte-macrophage colony-stimulating factor receptor subunit alpha-like isoform X4 [Parus major]|uniref:granulocyte-macrophage colony-stimulating factor receptor subunit alpha-like isoform X4 n=1 Tax=Parus major TaxID=9157 RepID=UPI00144462C8|nr:granulocyte-macrophage colony-stimulating factor receptor subunit alpha-like isoform X4 [Parus major]XP_033369664.1 granulocyte-macrophage colony-stimulating factor receptor subunit alpha-like isoform X4 [Parus major]